MTLPEPLQESADEMREQVQEIAEDDEMPKVYDLNNQDPESHPEMDYIVEVDNVHEAPEDATVHCHDDIGLYYVWDDDVLERGGGVEISDHIKVWVRDPNDAPDDVTLIEDHSGPEGNDHYYMEVLEQSFPDECRRCGENERVEGEFHCEECLEEISEKQDDDFGYPNAAPEDAPEEVREAVERFKQLPEEEQRDEVLLYWLLGTGTPEYKMSKSDAAYQPSPNGGEYCGSCEYAYYSNESGDLICSKVRGDVQWMGWCRLYDGTESDEYLQAFLEPPQSREEAMQQDWSPTAIVESMAKQMDMDVDVFRIVATENIADEYDGNLLAVGVDLPNHDVFVDWRIEAWPDGEQLTGPHVSVYNSMEDVEDVAEGEIEYIQTIDPEEGMLERSVPQQAVHYDSPDDVPEGARTIIGPQGGTYYIPPGSEAVDPSEPVGDEDTPGEAADVDLDDRTAQIGDSESHPVEWQEPSAEELDTYIDEVQETEFWSEGHESFEKAYDGDENTEAYHTDEEGNWDEERLQQHDEWAEELLNDDAATEEGEQPIGMVLLGPPGAGKGWWQEKVEEGAYGDEGEFVNREFSHISSDETKKPIPEYDGTNAAEVHDEASKIAKENLGPKAIEEEHNMILDKVAGSEDSRERLMDLVEEMQEAGYDMRVSYVDVPEEKSVHNAVGRYYEEGRFTPLDYTAGAREDSRQSFEAVAEMVDDEKVGMFNNDVEWGQPPEPVDVGDELLRMYKSLLRRHRDKEMQRFIQRASLPRDHATGRSPTGGRRRGRDSRVARGEFRDRSGRRSDPSSPREERGVSKGRRYVQDPSDAPDEVDVQEGPEGGYYYETDGGEQIDGESEESEGGEGSELTSTVDSMEVSDWPEEHTRLSEDGLRDTVEDVASRYKREDIADDFFTNFNGFSDKSRTSAWRLPKGDIVMQAKADEETVAHEMGHGVIGTYGVAVGDKANMFAQLFRGEIPEIEFDRPIPEIAEEMIGELLDSPDVPQDRKEDAEETLSEIQERFEGEKLEREDMYLFIDPNQQDADPPEDVLRLAEELNRAWDKQLEAAQTEDVDAENYVIGNAYSATNPHETMSMAHEVMQGGVVDPHALENFYRNQGELMDVYTDLFEPSPMQADLLNKLYEEFGSNEAFDEKPYPEHEGAF